MIPSKPKRLTREETRLAIIAKADELFRLYGYTKTAVADIARELGMSSANIYKFFPSKQAIVESSAERNLETLVAAVRQVTEDGGTAVERMEKTLLIIHRFHQQRVLKERSRMVEILMIAFDENWTCIRKYDDFFLETMSDLIQQGIEYGEFAPAPIRETAQKVIYALSLIFKPNLHSLHIPVEGEQWIVDQVHFVAKALK